MAFFVVGAYYCLLYTSVRSDEPNAAVLCFFQLCFQISHVVVFIAQTAGLTEANTIDNTGVIKLIGNNGIFGCEKGFKQAAVGVKTGGIEDRVLHTQKGGERCV